MRSVASGYRRLRLQTGYLAYGLQKPSSQGSRHLLERRQYGQNGKHQHHSFTTLISSIQQPIAARSTDENAKAQKRKYHSTPQNEMVLYGTIILVTTLGYVGYRKYYGLPLKPESVSESQSAYEKMEQDRQRRNEKHSNK